MALLTSLQVPTTVARIRGVRPIIPGRVTPHIRRTGVRRSMRLMAGPQSTGCVEPAGIGLAPVATRQWLGRGLSYRTLVRVEHQIRQGKDRNYALCFTLSLLHRLWAHEGIEMACKIWWDQAANQELGR